jgi:hypothetical protein
MAPPFGYPTSCRPRNQSGRARERWSWAAKRCFLAGRRSNAVRTGKSRFARRIKDLSGPRHLLSTKPPRQIEGQASPADAIEVRLPSRIALLLALAATAYSCRRQSLEVAPDAAARATTPYTPEAGPGGDDVRAACDAFAAASCDALEAEGWHYIERTFASRARCIERHAMLCRARAVVPHTGMTPAALQRCAANPFPDDCRMPGDLPNGRVCVLDAQCTSANCLMPRGALCGVCADPAPTENGWPCQNDRCGPDFACLDGKCYAQAPLGARCRLEVGCQRGASCENGRCVPRAVMLSHERGKGPPEIRGAEGDSCGAGQRTECFGETRCSQEPPRCARIPDVGESCEDGVAGTCLFPASCVHGKCALRSYDRCD